MNENGREVILHFRCQGSGPREEGTGLAAVASMGTG